MRHRRPSRIDDSLLPLAEHLHPRVQVEFEIVAGRIAEKEHRDQDGKDRCCDDQRSARKFR